ncbi:alpha/beta-hydrolase [Fonsecaea pedrosoi]|nr:alpha/beta-hydrolase [Fonsecaea pedrosoi]
MPTSCEWATALFCFSITLAAAHPEILWTDCSEHVPPSDVFNATGVDLQHLPSTLKCGRLVVPMDYSKPLSESNNITLGLAMHRPVQPKGVIFLFVYPRKRLMDIRGTYSSNPLNVSLDTVLPLFNPYPTSQDEFNTAKEIAAAAIQSWVDSSSPPGIVGHVGTREVVQDYNQIRQALGYEKIHFIGASYGSYRALQFAQTYPHSVGRFVLDAVVPHGVCPAQQAEHEMAAANRVLLRADAYCQNNSSCPFSGAGKGSVPEAYREIIKTASNSSIDTVWAIQATITGLLQDQPDFPQIIDLIAALSMNISALDALPQQALTAGSIVAYVLECGDSPLTTTFSGFQKSLNAGLALDTNNFGQTTTWLTQLACSAWPFDTTPLVPIRTEIPMLVVTADFDGSAPTEWTTLTMPDIPNGHLVVRHGDDHVSFNLPAQSSTAIAKRFLRTGILPGHSNNTFVTVYASPVKRGPIADPYSVPTGFQDGDVDSA